MEATLRANFHSQQHLYSWVSTWCPCKGNIQTEGVRIHFNNNNIKCKIDYNIYAIMHNNISYSYTQIIITITYHNTIITHSHISHIYFIHVTRLMIMTTNHMHVVPIQYLVILTNSIPPSKFRTHPSVFRISLSSPFGPMTYLLQHINDGCMAW